jgi:protein-disulfide isomerase
VSNRVRQKQAARLVREQLARERRRQRMLWTSIAAVVTLILAGVVGYAVYSSQRPAAGFAVPAGATSDRTGVAIGTGPVKVEIFLDYQCPACRDFEAAAGQKLAEYVGSNRITLIYHPVAILDRYSPNAYSSRSAATAGCAADGGRLREYTEALYARQPEEGTTGPTDEQLIQIGAGVGLGEPFARCVRDQRYPDWVRHVTSSMTDRRVTGTPTVFINGQKLPQNNLAALTAAVEAA